MRRFQEWQKKDEKPPKGHYFGYHLIMDLTGCNDNIKKREVVKQFAKEMVKRIKMKAVGEPIIRYLLPGTEKVGFSMMQLIETSDITAHFINPTGSIYCDVFSCKEFDPKVAEEVIKEFFEPKRMKTKFMIRDALKRGGV